MVPLGFAWVVEAEGDARKHAKSQKLGTQLEQQTPILKQNGEADILCTPHFAPLLAASNGMGDVPVRWVTGLSMRSSTRVLQGPLHKPLKHGFSVWTRVTHKKSGLVLANPLKR